MYLINKYILKNLIKNFVVSTFLFSFVALLTRVVHYAEIITEDGGSIKDLLTILLLIQPKIIAVLTPFTTCLSAFITYNSLIKSNEHIAIYNASLSQSSILKPLFYFCVPLFIAGIVTSSFIVPKSYKRMERLQNKLALQLSQSIIKPEEFIIQKNVMFFIYDITGEGVSKGVVIVDKREANKTILASDEGKIYLTNGIFGIRGENIYLYKNTNLTHNGIKARLAKYDFSLTLKESLNLNSSPIERENNSVIFKALKKNKNARKEFLQRIGMPFFTIILPLAIAILLLYYFNFARSKISYIKVVFATCMLGFICVSGFGAFEFFISSFQKFFLYFVNIFLIFIILLFILRARFFVKFFK